MQPVTLYEPGDPRYKALGRELGIHWHHARSIMVDVYAYMTHEETAAVRPKMLDAIAELSGFADAIVEVELGDRAEDGTIVIRGSHHAKWLSGLREKKRAAGKKRMLGATRDEGGRVLPKAKESDEQTSENPADDQQTSSTEESEPITEPAQPSAITITSTNTKEDEEEEAVVRARWDFGVDDFLDDIPIPIVGTWEKRFGIEFLRENIPKAWTKWMSNERRRAQGNKPLFIAHFLENEKSNAEMSRASPTSSATAAAAPAKKGAFRDTGKPCQQGYFMGSPMGCKVHASGDKCELEGRL